MGSISPANMRRNSNRSSAAARSSRSSSTDCTASASSSSTAKSSKSLASLQPASNCSIVATTASRDARSRPSDCALSGSSHTLGSDSSSSTSFRRSFLIAKSKIPPEHVGARAEVFYLIDEWCYFHSIGSNLRKISPPSPAQLRHCRQAWVSRALSLKGCMGACQTNGAMVCFRWPRMNRSLTAVSGHLDSRLPLAGRAHPSAAAAFLTIALHQH